MKTGRVLIPLYQDPIEYRLLEAAHQVMAAGNATLQVAYCRSEPVTEIPYGTEVATVAGLSIEGLEEQSVRTALNIKIRLQDWAGQHGYGFAPGQKQSEPVRVTFIERIGEPAEQLTRLGRLSDLIICSKPTSNDSTSTAIFESSVIQTGKPVLAIPPHASQTLFQHVLVAWDGSLMASRLVSLILPILRISQRVSIFIYPERDCRVDQVDGLQQYLQCHDIVADYVHVREGKPIAEALMGSAVAESISLVAMGAYSHGRPQQYLFGGLTRHMLNKTSLPLLMVH